MSIIYSYLSQRHQKDICLNTYRYKGVNTSSHALWILIFYHIEVS
jgi:hypothetical protein